jgi:hypothetical protein
LRRRRWSRRGQEGLRTPGVVNGVGHGAEGGRGRDGGGYAVVREAEGWGDARATGAPDTP